MLSMQRRSLHSSSEGLGHQSLLEFKLLRTCLWSCLIPELSVENINGGICEGEIGNFSCCQCSDGSPCMLFGLTKVSLRLFQTSRLGISRPQSNPRFEKRLYVVRTASSSFRFPAGQQTQSESLPSPHPLFYLWLSLSV